MNQVGLFSLVVAIYALISAFGLCLIKASQSIQTAGFLVGMVFYGAGFVVWLYMLRIYPLSSAFPAAAGAMIVATQIAGVLFLKESVQAPALIGSLLIGVGIVLISSTMVSSNG